MERWASGRRRYLDNLKVLLIAAAVVARRRDTPTHGSAIVLATVASCVAFTAIVYLVLRARHEPAINQGYATTWRQAAYVLGRLQYDVPGLWPRRAPAWLQLANWFEYADWQFGHGPELTGTAEGITRFLLGLTDTPPRRPRTTDE